MKRIVRGNDFTMRIPVVKIVDGEKVAFPLPGCTDIVVRLCSAYRRLELAHTIDAKEDNVIVARVEGDRIPFGTYALEVRGKIFGNDWRSNEYEQVAIVDRNADADTELGNTDEGEDSVEMDTAVVILPPDRELDALVKEALAQNKAMSELSDAIKVSEEGRAKSEELRAKSEGQRLAAEQGRASAESARVTAESARVDAENARVTAEGERVTAENARTEAEAARQEAEKTRATAEDTRARTEAEREANEQTREANEQTRRANEEARQEAEQKREGDTATAIATMKSDATAAVKTMQDATGTAIASMDEHRVAFDDAEAARVSNEKIRESQEQVRQEAEGKREESNAKFMASYEAAMSAAKEYLSEAECVSVQAEDIELEANKYYDITLASTNTLTLTLQATDDTTHAHDYEGGFDTDDNAVPTVTWPEGVQWADMPTLKYGRHYEFNVRDVGGKKYGVVYVWDKE